MPRSLSVAAKAALFAPQTGEVFLLLLTIAGPEITTIRVVANTQNVTSNGNTYIAFPFDLTLPDERDDQLARVSLRIDNVDRAIVNAVRTLVGPPTVTLQIVLASSPDTVEAGSFDFTLKEVTYDALVVEGELSFERVLDEGFPSGAFTPPDFPGLF